MTACKTGHKCDSYRQVKFMTRSFAGYKCDYCSHRSHGPIHDSYIRVILSTKLQFYLLESSKLTKLTKIVT